VKKGYARGVDSRQRSTLVLAHRNRVRDACRRVAPVSCAGIVGSLTASLHSGLSRCNWSFYRRCSPCREGAGKELAPAKREYRPLSQVSIANESDQVT